MRAAILGGLAGLLVGFGAGWIVHTRESVVIYRPLGSLPIVATNRPAPAETFPALPKPPLEIPIPTSAPTATPLRSFPANRRCA